MRRSPGSTKLLNPLCLSRLSFNLYENVVAAVRKTEGKVLVASFDRKQANHGRLVGECKNKLASSGSRAEGYPSGVFSRRFHADRKPMMRFLFQHGCTRKKRKPARSHSTGRLTPVS